ncbi:MAG: hypothetical protein M0035_08450 [Actinomycetota bacterium]|nr:hypothetical protein [Actinomycetota bacterium]
MKGHLSDEAISTLIDGQLADGSGAGASAGASASASASAATGARDSAAAGAHLAGCEICSARFQDLVRVRTLLAVPVAPPPAARREAALQAALASFDELRSGSPVADLRERRASRAKRARYVAIAAAAALVVAGVPVTVALTRTSTSSEMGAAASGSRHSAAKAASAATARPVPATLRRAPALYGSLGSVASPGSLVSALAARETAFLPLFAEASPQGSGSEASPGAPAPSNGIAGSSSAASAAGSVFACEAAATRHAGKVPGPIAAYQLDYRGKSALAFVYGPRASRSGSTANSTAGSGSPSSSASSSAAGTPDLVAVVVSAPTCTFLVAVDFG